MTRDIYIPGDGVALPIVLGAFRFLLIKIATNQFYLSFDGGSTFQLVSQNMNFVRPEQDRVIVKSYGGAASQVTLFYGQEPVTSQDTVVTAVSDSNLINSLAKCVEVIPQQFFRTANAGVATAFAAAQTFYRQALIIAKKDLNGTANVGNVKIGLSNAANARPITLVPDDTYAISVPVGSKADFQRWFFVTANNGDGIVIIYT